MHKNPITHSGGRKLETNYPQDNQTSYYNIYFIGHYKDPTEFISKSISTKIVVNCFGLGDTMTCYRPMFEYKE